MKVVAYHPLSRKERRAIMISIVVAAIYVALILWLTFSSYGILRGVNGGLMHSPFIAGILFCFLWEQVLREWLMDSVPDGIALTMT